MTHRMVRISHAVRETPSTLSILFEDDEPAMPGQFYMVWLPGCEEVPMSVSYCGDRHGITVANVGDTTAMLHRVRVGEALGIRGPYGTVYRPRGRTLLVGGGFGTASIAAVPDHRWQDDVHLSALVAAKTSEELLFVERLKRGGLDVHTATDDGTAGFCGLATDCVKGLLESNAFDTILACGPEPMMKGLLDISRERGIAYQASLERHMKCGVGVCDSCSVSGRQVCLDGPVFDGDILMELDEFGRFRRDPCGRRVPL